MKEDQEELWEKQRQRTIEQLHSGEIEHDNVVVLATMGDEIIITRVDLIPMSGYMIEESLNFIEGDF